MNLILQPVQIRHAPALFKLFRDPLVTKYLPCYEADIETYELSNLVGFCESAIMENENGMGMHRVILMDRSVVGYIGIRLKCNAHWGAADLEYWLGSAYFGQGIMPQAIRMLTTQAFDAHPHLQRIQCSIPAANGASRRAAEKAGFFHEATLKKNIYLHDVMTDECVFALLRQCERDAE